MIQGRASIQGSAQIIYRSQSAQSQGCIPALSWDNWNLSFRTKHKKTRQQQQEAAAAQDQLFLNLSKK